MKPHAYSPGTWRLLPALSWNQLVALLQNQAPRTISMADLLHPSVRLLSEIRSTVHLPGQAEISRPSRPPVPQGLAGRQGY
jgi:hypothetical protein